MGSQSSLWAGYGGCWGWPPPTMTFEQDRADLARHEREIEAHESFNYAVLTSDEFKLLGCVYIEPPGPQDDAPPGTDAVSSWWVVDSEAGGGLEAALRDFVPRWLTDAWGFRSVAEMRYLRRHHRPPVSPWADRISSTCTPVGNSIRNSGSRSR
jgi:hypothetical protein